MNSKVDQYLIDGCGRCALGGTPECKVHKWNQELVFLRSIILECDLVEEVKWSQPTYTYNGKNVLMMAAFKDCCFISFFKGSLMKDPKNLLEFAGPNSQIAKFIKFTDFKQIQKLAPTIKLYIKEAIEVEKLGVKVELKEIKEQSIPQELEQRLKKDSKLRKAFEALTPGRQRSYLIHIAQAKQKETRESRIDKCIPIIMEGRGFNEYK